MMIKQHSFHIPVMGIGYTIDTPVKVAHLGIDSVISLVDDIILEKLRKMYCAQYQLPYIAITEKSLDFRAERITSYLNMMNEIAEKKFEDFKNAVADKSNGIKEYFNMLPDCSELKQEFLNKTSKYFNLDEIKAWFNDNLSRGSIDANIMTKVDKDNYNKGVKLPAEYNDAHAALRGFAKSNLKSSIILSAGLNPHLYSYMEQFEDFYPDENGSLKKKIVLKVSDYKSALIQGKFLAKKGLWVSEYRIESGLNCGGHAFATDGYLLGPILAKFRDNRADLIQSILEIYKRALEEKGRKFPAKGLPVKITAQGGVGTAEEHTFLINHYELDSVGWGSPFLLVPEATTVDEETREQLRKAEEKDVYLSNISPLGIPFSSLKGNTKDIEKQSHITEGKPGSRCQKRFAALNSEFTGRGLCTASQTYQKKKIEEIDATELSLKNYRIKYDNIVEKSCICVGLGTSALLAHNLDTKEEGTGVSVCPGPNIAYFSKAMRLNDIVNHIYGRTNMMTRADRPNMFIKELAIYIDYLKEKVEESKSSMTKKQEKYFVNFSKNLKDGIAYYKDLFEDLKSQFTNVSPKTFSDLKDGMKRINDIDSRIETLSAS